LHRSASNYTIASAIAIVTASAPPPAQQKAKERQGKVNGGGL
jgi:hypothetical protein